MQFHLIVFGLLFSLKLSDSRKLSRLEYIWQQRYNKDRQYTRITKEMCINNRDVRNLKFCVLVRLKPQLLGTLSEQYMSTALNHWEESRVQDEAISLRNDTNLPLYTVLGKRRRRDAEKATQKVNNAALNRSKRDISGNPCLSGVPKRTTILTALDAENDGVVEVYQDPKNDYYQTFFTNNCARRSFLGMRCAVQYVVYLTAVFKDYSYNVVVRPVKIPTSCALVVSKYPFIFK